MTLNVVEEGSGPPLLIAHGLFGASRNWQGIARRLAADGWRVVLPDMRNHGQSFHAPAMDYESMAQDLHEVIRVMGLGPVSIIGHSMGGKAAMMLALLHEDLVERLVAVDVAPKSHATSLGRYAEAMRALPLDEITRRTEADARLAEAVPNQGVRGFLLQSLEIPREGRPHWRLNLDAIIDGMADIAGWPDPAPGGPYDGPALFLAGGDSDYVTADDMASVRALFPRARREVVPDTGHWLHAEAPDAVVESLRAFLDEEDL